MHLNNDFWKGNFENATQEMASNVQQVVKNSRQIHITVMEKLKSVASKLQVSSKNYNKIM